MRDSDLAFLRHHHAGDLGHTGASLLDHLRGTAAILESWGLPEHVVRAGLFHSVYGTDAFADAAVAPSRRAAVMDQIGARAEAIVHRFCALDRASLYANAGRAAPFAARERHGGASVALDAAELRDLFHLSVANWIEQRERLDPVVRRAHCDDYRRMLDHLAPRARAAVEAALDATLGEPASPTLAELFAFSDPDVVDRQCAELDVRYLGAVSQRLHEHVDRTTLDRLARLDDDTYLAILRAPETCYRLFASGQDLAGFLHDALRVEEWRDGSRSGLDRPAWSATADVYVPVGAAREPAAVYAPDRCYQAPMLDWIVVDLHSPAVHRQLERLQYKRDQFGPSEPFTDAERALVLDRLIGALAGIERTNPVVTRFLHYTLNTIIPRKQTRPHLHPTSFKGSSTAATLHRANIYNIQQTNVDIARLAQSIIHESVHNHLYKRELFEPTLVDDDAGEALRVTSPWSGNTLDFYVFVHSSIVYYALHQFFSQPLAATHLPPDTVACFRNRAVQGFGSRAWDTIVRAHGALISPGVRRDLWSMREVVTDAAPGVAA